MDYLKKQKLVFIPKEQKVFDDYFEQLTGSAVFLSILADNEEIRRDLEEKLKGIVKVPSSDTLKNRSDLLMDLSYAINSPDAYVFKHLSGSKSLFSRFLSFFGITIFDA
jgi:hypothetical protein